MFDDAHEAPAAAAADGDTVSYVFTTATGSRLAVPRGLYVRRRHDAPAPESDTEGDGVDGTWIDGVLYPSAVLYENNGSGGSDEKDTDGGDATSEEAAMAAGGGAKRRQDFISSAHFDHLVSRITITPAHATPAAASRTRRGRR